MRFNIGDVLVCRTVDENHQSLVGPDNTLMGPERSAALRAFKHGWTTLPSQSNDETVWNTINIPNWNEAPISEYTFWHRPYGGPTTRLTSPDQVDWETSGVK